MASLRSAIKKALKFCGDEGIFATCRFIPKDDTRNNGGIVEATDGNIGIRVKIDKQHDIPPCVVSKQSLVGAIAARKLEFVEHSDMLYLGDSEPTYRHLHEFESFPSIPEQPSIKLSAHGTGGSTEGSFCSST